MRLSAGGQTAALHVQSRTQSYCVPCSSLVSLFLVCFAFFRREVSRTDEIVALARLMESHLEGDEEGEEPLPSVAELIKEVRGGASPGGAGSPASGSKGPSSPLIRRRRLGVISSMGKGRVSASIAAPGGSISARETPLQSTVKKSMRLKRKRGDDGFGKEEGSPLSAESQPGGSSPRSGAPAKAVHLPVSRKRARLF